MENNCLISLISLVFDAAIVFISSFAIIQYRLNKKHELKSAATIVYNQLKEFDEYIENIKGKIDQEGDISDYHLHLINSVFESNAWGLNKHILIKSLSQDDIELINKTYSVIENIEYARKRVLDAFKTTNDAKSFALQFQAIEMQREKEGFDGIKELSSEFNKLPVYFSSRIPHDIFKNMVYNYDKMTGTQALARLRKLSYKNKE